MEAKLGAAFHGACFIIALPPGLAAIPGIVVLVGPRRVAAIYCAQLIPGLLLGSIARAMTAVGECRHAHRADCYYHDCQNRNCFFHIATSFLVLCIY